MDFIRRNYSLVSLMGSLVVGFVVFYLSFRSSNELLIEQTTQTIDVVTNVKWQLIERKLFSVEQQMNLLSKNDQLNQLLPGVEKKSASKPSVQLDDYVKSILYSQGYGHVWLLSPSGELLYNSHPELTVVPLEIQASATQPVGTQNSSLISVVLGEKDPFPFYFCKRITDTNGAFVGTLYMEAPREFLAVELHNTISLDSLNSYLASSQGILDERGRLNPDSCTTCKWDNSRFIHFSPRGKIRDTWELHSVYPISRLNARHIAYTASLDGLIAFLVATGIVMVIIYTIQVIQKSKGITHGDIMLVQTTWNAVSEYSTKVISGFYKHLFADAPEVRPMFRSEQAEQEKRMASMINTIVNSADSLEEFKGSIAQLAKKHVHMGVKREYFPVVVKAIISSVEDQYGKGFTSAHKKSWYKILNQVAAIMIEEMESYQRTLRDTPAHTTHENNPGSH